MSSTKAVLNELAQLTMLTGRISETHQKNMEMFPKVFFHGVKEFEIDYDIATNREDSSTVIYKLQIDPVAPNDLPSMRYKSLENAIRTLFWKEVRVEIQINNEEVFKSE